MRRKYRVVVQDAGGRRLTRHLRAVDKADAERQAEVIAGLGRPLDGAEAAVLGAPPGARWSGAGKVLAVEEMGVVGKARRT